MIFYDALKRCMTKIYERGSYKRDLRAFKHFLFAIEKETSKFKIFGML